MLSNGEKLFRTPVMRKACTAADEHTDAVHSLEHKLVPSCTLTNYTCSAPGRENNQTINPLQSFSCTYKHLAMLLLITYLGESGKELPTLAA